MSQPVNNTTSQSVDYKPFPMVIPSSWDPITQKYHKDKLKQLKELVTLATERGVLQQLVNAATTQDEVLIEPSKETDLNRLVRENKKNEILSIKANQAIIADQVEKSVISRRKKLKAVKEFNDNYKPIKEFKGDLSEFLTGTFFSTDSYENPVVFQQIYDVLTQLQFPPKEVNDLKNAIENAPDNPTNEQQTSVFNIKKRLELLKKNVKSTLKKDLSNLPEFNSLQATLDVFITLMDEILTLDEFKQSLTIAGEQLVQSPSFQQNFGSVLNPQPPGIPSEFQQQQDMQEAQDYPLAPQDLPVIPERSVSQSTSGATFGAPPPLRKPLKLPPPIRKPIASPEQLQSKASALKSSLRPLVLASATPIAPGLFVDDPEKPGEKVELGSVRYNFLRDRYGIRRDGSIDASVKDALMNALRDRLIEKNRKFNEEDSELDGDAFGTSGTGFKKLKPLNVRRRSVAEQRQLLSRMNKTGFRKGIEYKVDSTGKLGDVDIDMKKLAANVLKAKKGKKIILQKPLSDGLKALLTKRFSKSMNYTQDDLDDFALICKEAQVPIKGGNLKAEIIKGTIKPTKQSKKVKILYYSNPKELEKRLAVICGSIDAGNGSPDLKEEGSQILDILKGHKMVSETDSQTLIDSWL